MRQRARHGPGDPQKNEQHNILASVLRVTPLMGHPSQVLHASWRLPGRSRAPPDAGPAGDAIRVPSRPHPRRAECRIVRVEDLRGHLHEVHVVVPEHEKRGGHSFQILLEADLGEVGPHPIGGQRSLARGSQPQGHVKSPRPGIPLPYIPAVTSEGVGVDRYVATYLSKSQAGRPSPPSRNLVAAATPFAKSWSPNWRDRWKSVELAHVVSTKIVRATTSGLSIWSRS